MGLYGYFSRNKKAFTYFKNPLPHLMNINYVKCFPNRLLNIAEIKKIMNKKYLSQHLKGFFFCLFVFDYRQWHLLTLLLCLFSDTSNTVIMYHAISALTCKHITRVTTLPLLHLYSIIDNLTGFYTYQRNTVNIIVYQGVPEC
jgi:hypothetical protein